jgi:hypothetical protein
MVRKTLRFPQSLDERVIRATKGGDSVNDTYRDLVEEALDARETKTAKEHHG